VPVKSAEHVEKSYSQSGKGEINVKWQKYRFKNQWRITKSKVKTDKFSIHYLAANKIFSAHLEQYHEHAAAVKAHN
jgi:hypothetical protein